MEFVDPVLLGCSGSQVVRCMHIGLLCVQEDPEQRPTMSNVVVLLGSESVDLPQPRQPAFSLGRVVIHADPSASTDPAVNESIWSSVTPR